MKILSRRSTLPFRGAVFLFWIILVALLVEREVFVTTITPGEQQLIDQAAREEYQGIYFREKKIGHVVNKYEPVEGGGVRVNQQAYMNLNVGEMTHKIELQLDALLNEDATLNSFTFLFTSPFYRMTADGEVLDDVIEFTLTTGNNTIRDRLRVSSAPLVPTARRGYLISGDLEVGEKMKVPWFDPVSLTAKDSVVEYWGKEKIQINGRVHDLHKFIENHGGARVSIWLNDEGDVIKEESPAGFVFIKEPKFRALELADTSDELLAAVAVPLVGEMGNVIERDKIQYRLSLPEETEFDLAGGRQHLDGDVLTVVRETLPIDNGLTVTCENVGDSLAATPYIQSEAPPIQEMAAELLGGEDTLLGRVQVLADWVYNNLEKRPVLGIPDAMTTLENRIGDCNEHAALFAAFARSSGIPTRIAAGVVYHKGAFYYHAWNEVCVGADWLTVDTTTNQLPADVSHIRFVEGELGEQMRIGSLLGRLSIEVLPDLEDGE